MSLVIAPDSLQPGSNHGSLSPATNATGQLIGANEFRNGLNVQVDPATAATTPVLYLLLASSGTPSASNFDVAVTPTLPWDGTPGAGQGVWRGAVQYKWAGSSAVNVSVTEA